MEILIDNKKYKITESEKQLYNKLAKIVEGKNVK